MESEGQNLDKNNAPIDQNDHHDDSDSEVESSNDLGGIGSSATELININTKYQPNWGGAEAFREFYQNFKDGIIRSFRMAAHDFKPEYEEHGTEIIIKVFHPTERDPLNRARLLCGFIRFQYDSKDKGVLEMTNFNSKLHRWHLGFGGTSKAKETEQAGQHGEGMKLAALIMRRNPQNHTIRIQASDFMWRFGFNTKKMLTCTLTRIKEPKIDKAKAQARRIKKSGLGRELEARSWEDVSIVIGESRVCRTIAGEVKKSSKIPLETFQDWLCMTIDICPPEDVIRTQKGDIIFDDDYRNNVYLHGLLLSNGESGGLNFKYGYNFHEGKTGRDRDMLGILDEDNERLAHIWSDAIHAEAKLGTSEAALERYATLLDDSPDSADVLKAEDYLSEDIARMLLAFLRKFHREEGQEVPFFYRECETDWWGPVMDMNRNPLVISDQLWRVLHKHGLCMSMSDIRTRSINNAVSVKVATAFGANLVHALKTCLSSVAVATNKDITFWNTRFQRPTVYNTQEGWKVRADYLSFMSWHLEGYCQFSGSPRIDGDTIFVCDHVVSFIFEDMLFRIPDINTFDTPVARHRAVESANAKLSLMPRGITLLSTGSSTEMAVSWVLFRPPPYASPAVRVSLHSSKCEEYDTLRSTFIYNPEEVKCSCPSMVSDGVCTNVTFADLDPQELYLPMLSQNSKGAFFGLPPTPTRPSDPALTRLPSPPTLALPDCTSPKPLVNSIADVFTKTYASNTSTVASTTTNQTPTTEDVQVSESVPADAEKMVGFQAVNCKHFPWDTNFPSGYDWVQAEHSDSHILIAKPKVKPEKDERKRTAEDDGLATAEKKPRV